MAHETKYAECGRAGSAETQFDYHSTGCPHATFPWAPGERICGFTDLEASNAQRLRNLEHDWCTCGNPSGNNTQNGKFHSCVDCGKLISVG